MYQRFALMTVFFALSCSIGSTAQDVEKARFHHVHLNVTDPAKSIEFFQNKNEKASVKAGRVWFLKIRARFLDPSCFNRHI